MAPRTRLLLPLAVSPTEVAAYQGPVSGMEVLPGWLGTDGGHPTPRTDARQPASDNVGPVFAIHQIRLLAAGQVSPASHTQDEAQAAHTAVVSDIFAALRTALTRHPGNPDALTFPMP